MGSHKLLIMSELPVLLPDLSRSYLKLLFLPSKIGGITGVWVYFCFTFISRFSARKNVTDEDAREKRTDITASVQSRAQRVTIVLPRNVNSISNCETCCGLRCPRVDRDKLRSKPLNPILIATDLFFTDRFTDGSPETVSQIRKFLPKDKMIY